jgi:hypothetical protein|nr:MAG TPA: RecA like NTPase recombinase [Crassvirales sp.]
MANLIGIVGEAGSGKSTSIGFLNPEETVVISVANKPLPIKGFVRKYKELSKENPRGNLLNESNVNNILFWLEVINQKRPDIKNVVIDDAQYLMSFELMNRAEEKSYDKFTQIASHFYTILKKAMIMRPDLNIVFMIHSENVGDALNPQYKMKTVGKMLDTAITLEGLFTYVIFTRKRLNDDDKPVYEFVTNYDGTNTAKTPAGCFDSLTIPNNLQLVVDAIYKYNNEE